MIVRANKLPGNERVFEIPWHQSSTKRERKTTAEAMETDTHLETAGTILVHRNFSWANVNQGDTPA